MNPLLGAFQFLTIFPTVIRRDFTPQELGRSVGWYPLVGLGIGAVLSGISLASDLIFTSAISAVLVLIAWILLTRALHLDGFMDICDGLFGGFTPEDRLQIMRDSRVGAFGIAGGMLLLLAKYAVLVDSPRLIPGLLLSPVLGRWVLSLALFAFPYARSHGLGRQIKDNMCWPQVALASLIALLVAWLAAGWLGLVACILAAVVLLLGAGYMLRLLPGLTGDGYGALCELTELTILLVFDLKMGS